MIRFLSPEIIFDISKKVIITGKFLFEQESSSSLATEDGQANALLPYHLRNLEIEISQIKLPYLILSHINSIGELRINLRKIQENVVQNIYKAYQVSSMLAYLSRIRSLSEEFTPEISTVIENYEELANEGYHPDLLDHKIFETESELRDLMKKELVNPFNSWMRSLCEILEKCLSPRSARLAIKERTQIYPSGMEERNSRVELNFSLKRSRSIESSTKIYDFLVERSMIIDTSIEKWKCLFTQKGSPKKKIVWNDSKPGELRQFIDILIDRKFIEDSPSKWATAAKHFTLLQDSENLSSRLKSNVKSKKSHNIIELHDLVTEIVKDIVANSK